MRPGRLSRVRRRVLATTSSPRAPSPIAAIQRSRLWASVAITSQAALAANSPGGMMPQPDPVFEVADAQLHRGVAAVILVQPHRGARPVGDNGVVAPVGEQLGLGADQAGTAHDQPVALVAGLGDLRDAAIGVDDRCPGVL